MSKLDERGVKFGLSNVLTHKEQTNTILQQWIQENNFYVWHLNKNYSNSNYQSNKAKTSLTDEVFISDYKPQSSQFTLTF